MRTILSTNYRGFDVLLDGEEWICGNTFPSRVTLRWYNPIKSMSYLEEVWSCPTHIGKRGIFKCQADLIEEARGQIAL